VNPLRRKSAGFLMAGKSSLHVFRIILLSWLVLFLIPEQVRPAGSGQAQGLLWEARGRNNTVYLLGSLHVMMPEAYPLPPRLEEAYQQCNLVALESDPDESASPAFAEKMLRLGRYPSGQTLKQQLSSSTYQRLEKRVISHGLTMQAFEGFRPWLAGLTLSVLEFQKLGFSPAYGIDQYFFSRSKKDGKKRAFLETADFQVGLFASLVDHDAENLLRQMLDELEDLTTMAAELLETWRSGDEAHLYNLIHDGFEAYPALYETIMLKRNRSWIPEIEKFLQMDEDVLVIVGAGHLVGPDSLIDLLRRTGHRVEP